MKTSSVVRTIVSGVLHALALGILFVAFRPVAQWYIARRPILGVDFFNTATHAQMLLDTFALPAWGLKYFWFGGYPIFLDLALFWFYPVFFVGRFLPLISSVKFAMVGSFFLLAVFVYLAAYRISRHQLLSAVLAVLVVYSANMYGSLTWGGSLPYFANQLFFPAILWLLASYLATGGKRWYWGAVFVLGIAFLGHAMNAGTFMLPGATILLLFGSRKRKLSIGNKLAEIFVLFFGAILLSFRVGKTVVLGLFQGLLSGTLFRPFGYELAPVQFSEGATQTAFEDSLAAYERSRFPVLFSDTNSWLFVLFGLSAAFLLISLVVDPKKRRLLQVFPWLLLAGYSVLHVLLNSYGFPFLPQAWYRAFWHFPITLALLIAAIIGYSAGAVSRATKTVGRILFVGLIVFSVAAFGVVYRSDELGKMIAVVDQKSSPSSAYPEAINLIRNHEELEQLKTQLVPDWLDPMDRNWRIYESDAQVNVWWNALFTMPMARGYIDPPQPTSRMGHIFLTDQALGSDGLVENFDYPVDVARNMAHYYIDWNAIRYFEGGHVSISDNKAPSSYLEEDIAEHTTTETVGLYRLYETASGKPEIQDVSQYLEYYRFADALVSPVISVSNAPTIMCFCSWQAYEAFTKVFSMNNLHSRIAVTAFADEPVDSLTGDELGQYDLVVLSDYQYRSRDRAFSLLTDYVADGGKVFIDTGSETPDSEAKVLPAFFPFSEAVREGLGSEWDLDIADDPALVGITFDAFSDPVFDGADWKFSHPVSGVDESADVLLRQKGFPILVRWTIGSGEAVWSGMNLAYHVHANTNLEESRFVVNLFFSLMPLEEQPYIAGKPEFINSREVRIQSEERGKGVLFKEQFYPGWVAKVNGKRARIYAAGPAFPGFMYVPLSDDGPVDVRFTYYGDPMWYVRDGFSALLGIVLLDLFLFDGRLIGRRLTKIGVKLRVRIGHWWEREEE